jgi:thiol-disulfide isomerase/thioredoxin
MNATRQSVCGLVVTLVATFAVADAPKPETEVTLEFVKWPELAKAIAGHKGKVVVMDVWANYCIPCKKEFHHLVELHNKYTKEGLDCLSLTVDDKDEKKDVDAALAFLKSQKAVFGNYLIDEPAEVWAKRLDVGGPPAVLIYDRSGKKVKTFTSEDPFTYEDVEKAITPLLKSK